MDAMHLIKKPLAGIIACPLALILLSASVPVLAAGGPASTTNRFGFAGPEIFPIDNLISHLRCADIDGDGLRDIVVVNNARSRINILYNQTGRTPAVVDPKARRELNELPPDARFRIESIASEKRISSLVVADLNGDKRPDLAYFGEPKELVIQYNLGTNGWSAPKRLPADEGMLEADVLTDGDLNGDGRNDLVLLGESSILFFAQKADGQMAEPEKIPYSGELRVLQVLDIDGDGRQDLLLVKWDHANPLRFRLQNASGQLGPEMHFPFPPIRSYWADDLDGDKKTEVITISQKSGRAQILNFVTKPSEVLSGNFKLGQFQVMPLTRTAKAKRGMVWADINKDQRADLLVAEPDSGQLTVFLQQPDGTMAAPRTFPTLTGVGEVRVADWDGDGVPEIFLLSSDERQVGVTRYDEKGRVPFPTIIPLEGRPLTMAVGVLADKAKPSLAVIVEQDNRKELVVRSADGKLSRQKLAESLKSVPSGMVIHDVNQDGLADLVVLVPYEKIKVLIQQADKPFAEEDVAPPGGSAEQPWVASADVDGDGKEELLLAQKNFLRAVILQAEPVPEGSTNKPSWTFKVREQINGVSPNSRIVGACALPKAGSTVPSLFLLDAERKSVTLCERDAAGVWQVTKNVSLPVADFGTLQSIGLGAPTPNSVGFLGVNAVAWLPLLGNVWDLQELDDYETPIREGFLHDVVSGDLNQDGRKDLVFLETSKNYLDIVTFEPPHQLVPANRWQVFEERTFRSRRSEMPEPREAIVSDVTGDGKNDLVVLVHDRVLVYPQE